MSTCVLACSLTSLYYRGGYRILQKGGLRPEIRNARGGRGCVLSASGLIQKVGEGRGVAVKHSTPYYAYQFYALFIYLIPEDVLPGDSKAIGITCTL